MDQTMKHPHGYQLHFSSIDESTIIRTILNNSQDTIYFKDRDSRLVLSSRAHALLYGCDDPNEVIGKTDFDYFPEEFAQQAFAVEQKIMETAQPIVGITERLVRPDGKIMWLSASKYPLYNENNEIIGTWGTSRNITELKVAEENLRELNEQLQEANRQLRIFSAKDVLSGLYNQGHFFSEIHELYALFAQNNQEILEEERKNHSENQRLCTCNACHKVDCFSLVLFDVDDFKDVNDKYGHLMGDFLIRHIGNLVKSEFPQALCFRYGGDEFAIILKNVTLEEAKHAAESIRVAIELTPFRYLENEIYVTVSVGVSSVCIVDSVESLIRDADEKMYVSKHSGKNRVS